MFGIGKREIRSSVDLAQVTFDGIAHSLSNIDEDTSASKDLLGDIHGYVSTSDKTLDVIAEHLSAIRDLLTDLKQDGIKVSMQLPDGITAADLRK